MGLYEIEEVERKLLNIQLTCPRQVSISVQIFDKRQMIPVL